MKNNTTKAAILLGIVALVASALVSPNRAEGQSAGNNAVYNSSGTCSPKCAASTAFIDASVLFQSDICTTIYNILQPVTYSASVIDARGINGTAALTCPTNTTPWLKGGTPLNKPSTIMLPAGTIQIPTTWTLPPSTHLIGVGSNITSGFTPGTTLVAHSSFSGSAMMSFCTAACTGIGVENLTLDGQGQTIDGIDNANAQDLTYVDHVGLYRIVGTGLSVSGIAKNSGPYTNITFDMGGAAGSASTHCASINGLASTRGIRNLTCISESGDLPAAVLLDSSSNLLKDVTIAGFYDGILVGANAPAKSNVLINIIGDTSSCQPICPNPIRAIHISSNQTGGSNNVSDLSIVGVGNDVPSGTYTIGDDLTGAQIIDPYVGLYVLGKLVNNGYARFTTSPSYATWAVGTGAPSGTCTQGSLYSCTGGTTTCKQNTTAFALWGCPVMPGGAWVGIK